MKWSLASVVSSFVRGTLILFVTTICSAQELSIRPLIGGFPADSGFALGASVSRTHVAGKIDGHVKGILSVKKYQLYEAGIDVPEFTPRFSFGLAGRYRNFPQEDFWGIGPNTPQDARTNYLYEDVNTTATLSTRIGRFRTGVSAGFLKINTGPGRDDRFPSVPESLQSSPTYTHTGAFLRYESVDDAADPHKGGKYSLEWTNYAPGLQRYVVDVRHFIPVTSTDRIGLRAQTLFTHSTPDVPFFMLPTVGGIDTIRGFNQYRFRDRNALVLNSEYRRPLGGFLDLVAFADAGRVFARAQNLGLRDLHPTAGIGVRVKFGSRVFFGIDLGFSDEGHKLWFRSDQMF
jgi:outer membrane protein assembly factor BamA